MLFVIFNGSRGSMSKVKLVWATPQGEELVAYMARVSNPENQDKKETAPKLLKYLANNKHWSPFEMVNVCMEIETTRDIARQILRHRSFSFQEFSQRYAVANDYALSEVRLQDDKNRQNSLPTEDRELQRWWDEMQRTLIAQVRGVYGAALNNGIAKEVARKLLPEGLTMSRMYMNGTLRSWMHYVDIRCDAATQKEHRDVADKCKAILKTEFQSLFKE
jgi:thymidylate synthase (FAD)